MSQQISYYTEEGLQKLKDELYQMKMVERKSISQQIADAKDKGDLSENAEYDAAKEAQGLLEMKINKLENVVANARVVDSASMSTDKALILCFVTVKNLKINKEVTYQLVAENEASLKDKKISVESPIGRGLLGKKIGEVAEIETPGGVIQFEITEISR